MQQKPKNLLKSLEKTRHKYWNIDRTTGQFLNLLIKTRKYKTVLEIGTSNGYSALWIAEALTQTGGHLYTMESHKKDRYLRAKENFEKSGLKNITLILGHAPEDIPSTPHKFDLAFFDATKHEHECYFKALENRIKNGGLIITDNLCSHKTALTSYKKALLSSKNWESTYLDIGAGLMISKKTAC